MCGRYLLVAPIETLARLFGFDGPALNLARRWNIAPTQVAPVVRRREHGGLELAMLRWGLVPYWASDASVGSRMINARGESVAEKPAYKAAFRSRRCLVPADGFYEWPERGPLAVSRTPVLFRASDGAPFAFAGIWERWVPPGGGVLETYAILSTAADGLMAQYHHRVPVVLDRADYGRWLDPDADASTLIAPPPIGRLVATPVSTHVNNVRNDDEACIASLSPDAPAATPRPVRKGRGPAPDDRQGSLF